MYLCVSSRNRYRSHFIPKHPHVSADLRRSQSQLGRLVTADLTARTHSHDDSAAWDGDSYRGADPSPGSAKVMGATFERVLHPRGHGHRRASGGCWRFPLCSSRGKVDKTLIPNCFYQFPNATIFCCFRKLVYTHKKPHTLKFIVFIIFTYYMFYSI